MPDSLPGVGDKAENKTSIVAAKLLHDTSLNVVLEAWGYRGGRIYTTRNQMVNT